MKIAILSPGYPSEHNRYNSAFVHRRATLYSEQHDVRVFLGSGRFGLNYDFEGVSVAVRTGGDLSESIIQYDPDVLFVHSPHSGVLSHGPDVMNVVEEVQSGGFSTVTWLHGYECIDIWKYYPSDILTTFREDGVSKALWEVGSEVVHTMKHRRQLRRLREYLENRDESGDEVVFVSEWLKEAVVDSIGYRPTNARIIPNPIDDALFEYREREEEQVTDLLSIRPFSSRKYANDLSVRAAVHLKEGTLDIYGKGKLLERCRRLRNELGAPVNFHPRFLSQQEMADLHDQYGVYLTPSRLDAQGVSMCEAMSSGLPVVTSPVGGIPEFVDHGETGFLCEDPNEMASCIRRLQDNPAEMVEMGRRAAKSIREHCASTIVIEQELSLAESHV